MDVSGSQKQASIEQSSAQSLGTALTVPAQDIQVLGNRCGDYFFLFIFFFPQGITELESGAKEDGSLKRQIS